MLLTVPFWVGTKEQCWERLGFMTSACFDLWRRTGHIAILCFSCLLGLLKNSIRITVSWCGIYRLWPSLSYSPLYKLEEISRWQLELWWKCVFFYYKIEVLWLLFGKETICFCFVLFKLGCFRCSGRGGGENGSKVRVAEGEGAL